MLQQAHHWVYLKEVKELHSCSPIRHRKEKRSAGYLSADEWTKKMYSIYTMGYHPIKKIISCPL